MTVAEQANEARARARAQNMAVRQANRGFEIARVQFREGPGGRIELTDAEVALRGSEFNYAQAVYDYLVARAQLDAATGRVPLGDPDVPLPEVGGEPSYPPTELDGGGESR